MCAVLTLITVMSKGMHFYVHIDSFLIYNTGNLTSVIFKTYY